MGHEKLLFENDELCVGTCLFSVCVALLAFLCTEFSSDFRIYSVGVCVYYKRFVYLLVHSHPHPMSLTLSKSKHSMCVIIVELSVVCFIFDAVRFGVL